MKEVTVYWGKRRGKAIPGRRDSMNQSSEARKHFFTCRNCVNPPDALPGSAPNIPVSPHARSLPLILWVLRTSPSWSLQHVSLTSSIGFLPLYTSDPSTKSASLARIQEVQTFLELILNLLECVSLLESACTRNSNL